VIWNAPLVIAARLSAMRCGGGPTIGKLEVKEDVSRHRTDSIPADELPSCGAIVAPGGRTASEPTMPTTSATKTESSNAPGETFLLAPMSIPFPIN
jgi:hypothetical protein